MSADAGMHVTAMKAQANSDLIRNLPNRVYTLGARRTTLQERFFNTVNLRPRTLFCLDRQPNSAGLHRDSEGEVFDTPEAAIERAKIGAAQYVADRNPE